ncbi:MAG: hypothetical protein AAFQ90_12725 [Pseudomonadota bacterium]
MKPASECAMEIFSLALEAVGVELVDDMDVPVEKVAAARRILAHVDRHMARLEGYEEVMSVKLTAQN